jgi:predicted transposase YbfD/YdcC
MTLFRKHFSAIPDPRVQGRSDHLLLDIFAITILAVICGADGWDDIAEFGRLKQPWLSTFLELPAGIPSADTFRRVFSALKPNAFRCAFVGWAQDLVGATQGKLVVLDGKTARRSFDRTTGKSALHLVSAWVRDNHLTLGQIATEAKSNEITAIPALLGILDVRGAIVSIDAMGTQKAIAQTIVDQGADYLLALKGNQGKLHAQVADFFADAETERFADAVPTVHQTCDEAHGRREVRRVRISEDLSTIAEATKWPALKSIILVERERQTGDTIEREQRYFISSRGQVGAELMASLIRGHWSIENECHWVLDIAFREDDSRIRRNHGPENFGLVRKIALNLLKQETTYKRGIAAKRKLAGWDHDYLLKILSGPAAPD